MTRGPVKGEVVQVRPLLLRDSALDEWIANNSQEHGTIEFANRGGGK